MTKHAGSMRRLRATDARPRTTNAEPKARAPRPTCSNPGGRGLGRVLWKSGYELSVGIGELDGRGLGGDVTPSGIAGR